MLTLSGASLLALAPVALAQQTVWGQCGGIGWTGPTTCISGNECIKQNDWYSQCLPSTATPSSSSSTVVSFSSTTSSSSIPQPTGANYWFSFGDSYTQTGFDPYGTLPSADNPIGNPTFPGWTSTGGVNWVGAGTTTFNKSHILTYNYAYGGATIDSDLVTPYQPTVISLTEQVDQYLATAGTKPPSTPWTGSNSLFSIWIGINDIGNSFWLEGRDAFSDTLLNAEFALVQKLYDSGARNFLFVNVPPINGPRTRRELLSRPSMQSSRHKQPHSKLATLGLRLTFGTRMLRSRGFGLANLVWICGRHHFRCRVWHILGR